MLPRPLPTSRIRYRVTSSWIRNVLREGGRERRISSALLQPDLTTFSELLVLLRHDAMESDGAIQPDLGIVSTLRGSFCEARLSRFVADARKLSGDGSLSIRDGNIRLATDNPLTGLFLPPSSAEVRTALAQALCSIQVALQKQQGAPGRIAVCAFLGSQVILTIHPFFDGNGRTARMFYAAQLLRHGVTAPNALLGMMLIYRGEGHRYHQASWALRAGDVQPMLRLYVDSLALADTLFPASGLAHSCPMKLLLDYRNALRAQR